jgi:hypothetical protein
METIRRYYQIDRKEICFVKSIIEAYDGMAVLRTVDPKKAVIEFSVAPGCEEELKKILDDLRNSISIEVIKGDMQPILSAYPQTIR